MLRPLVGRTRWGDLARAPATQGNLAFFLFKEQIVCVPSDRRPRLPWRECGGCVDPLEGHL